MYFPSQRSDVTHALFDQFRPMYAEETSNNQCFVKLAKKKWNFPWSLRKETVVVKRKSCAFSFEQNSNYRKIQLIFYFCFELYQEIINFGCFNLSFTNLKPSRHFEWLLAFSTFSHAHTFDRASAQDAADIRRALPFWEKGVVFNHYCPFHCNLGKETFTSYWTDWRPSS